MTERHGLSNQSGRSMRAGLSPDVALVCVVRQGEGGYEHSAGHGAHLLAQTFSILADPLVPAQFLQLAFSAGIH